MYEIVTAPVALRLVDPVAIAQANPGMSTPDSEAIADAVSRTLAISCNRVFARQRTRQGFMPGAGSTHIALRHWPVSSIISVVEDKVTLATPADYRLSARDGFLYRREAGEDFDIPWGSQVIVTYESGWNSTGEVPPDLQRIAASLATTFAAMPTSDPRIKAETVVGVHSITYRDEIDGEGLPPFITKMLRACGYIDPVLTP